VNLWFPARDARVRLRRGEDADPVGGAITATRAEHFFQPYIYARWNMTPARKAAIDKEMSAAPNTLFGARDALARSITKVPVDFGGIGGAL